MSARNFVQTQNGPQRDLNAENRLLRTELDTLKQQISANETILAKILPHEWTLLTAGSLKDLLTFMVRDTTRSFELSTATLAFEDQALRRLLISGRCRHDDIASSIYIQKLSDLAPFYPAFEQPYVGPYQTVAHRYLFPNNISINSVALVPLRTQDRLLGGLNLGSEDPDRFTFDHSTDFLNHFGRISAICLENALNREQLVQNTITDSLTECYNRRYLEERLQEELARAQRSRRRLCCLFIDLDHFKQINDKYGHLTGDKTLREVAQRLHSQLRINDIIARYGGEEFTALLPDTKLTDAINMAERVREAIRVPMLLGDQVVNISASIGICEYAPRGYIGNLDEISKSLLSHADEALYRAKAAGRNCVRSAAKTITY